MSVWRIRAKQFRSQAATEREVGDAVLAMLDRYSDPNARAAVVAASQMLYNSATALDYMAEQSDKILIRKERALSMHF